MSYTSGPWNAVSNPDDMPSFQVLSHFRASIETSDGSVTVAYLPELGHEDTNPQLRANAYLIAAAPSMAETLVWIHENLHPKALGRGATDAELLAIGLATKVLREAGVIPTPVLEPAD